MKSSNTTNPEMINTHGTKKGSRIISVLFALLFALGSSTLLTACEDQGPVEEAGEEVDEAVEETGDAIDDTGDDIDDDTDGD